MNNKTLRYTLLAALLLSFIYISCAPNDPSGPTPPPVFGTPTVTRTFTPFVSPTNTPIVTATITPTQSEALPTPAINLPNYTVSAEVRFDNFDPAGREFLVRVNNGSTDGNHASLVRVRNITKSTACVLTYESGTQAYRIDALGGALAYFPGDTYRVEVTISGSVFVAQSAAPGSVSASPYSAGTGVTLNIENNGNEDRVIVYDEAADSIIYDVQEPGTAIGSSYSIPAGVFTIGQNYNVTAFITKALGQSAAVFNGLHNYSYLYMNYTHDTYYLEIGVPTPTVTPTDTPELPTWTYTITATPTEEDTPVPEDTATATPTAYPTDTYEPDNTYLQAGLLSEGTQSGHVIAPYNDEDWYKIILTSPGMVTITAAASDPSLYAGTYVYYYTESGAASLSHYWLNTGNGEISPAHYWQYLDAGTYYIRVLSGFGHIIPYSITYGLTEYTATVTPTLTETSSPTPTFTVTYQADSYEDDDTPLTAGAIAKGETQTRSIFPQADDDFAVYNSPGNEIITASCWGESNTYYVLDFVFNTEEPYSAGFTREESTGGTEIVILDKMTPGPVYVRVRGDLSNEYYLSLNAAYMTATATPTISPTHTASPTATASPTMSPTAGAWSFHASSVQTNCSHPALATDGTSLSYGHVTTSLAYVNGSSISVTPNPARMGKRWLFKTSSYDYAAVVHTGNNIMVKSSADWTTNIGGTGVTIGAAGWFPSLYVDGSTPYVAFADSANGNSITVRAYASSWGNYGSALFTPPVPVNRGNAVALDGCNDGTLKLFVAYIDSVNGNRIGIKWKNGASDWADFGTGIVTANGAYHIDMDVVSENEIYVQYSWNGGAPVIVKWNGASWNELGITFSYNSSDNSVNAAAYNEIYSCAYRTDTTRAVAKRFDGTGGTNLNSDQGFSDNGISQPCILKAGPVVYASYIYNGYAMVYKYQ